MSQFRKFDKALRGLLAARRLSQKELSERSGVHRGKISQYVNGHVQPNLETLGKLLDAADATVADLWVELRRVDPELQERFGRVGAADNPLVSRPTDDTKLDAAREQVLESIIELMHDGLEAQKTKSEGAGWLSRLRRRGGEDEE